MTKKYNTAPGQDKFDGWMPNKREFAHDHYLVGKNTINFHNTTAYMYRDSGDGHYTGINKRMWKVSGCGLNIDSSGQGLFGLSDLNDG